MIIADMRSCAVSFSMFQKLVLLVSIVTAQIGATPRPPSTRNIPFVETFERDSKTLVYVAANHHSSVQYPDAMTDPTFRTIESVFSTVLPDAVIIEGVDPSQLQGFLKYAAQCAAANYSVPGAQCEEGAFAAYSAVKNGKPVYTGEPSAADELSFLKAHGYSIQDFFALWIMNNIPPEKRHGQLTDEKFRVLAERVVRNENYELGTAVNFSTDDFAAWYTKRMRVPRNYLDIAANDTAPEPTRGEPDTILHTLSGLVKTVRDQHIVSVITTVLRNHNRVLVVYGASHLDFEWRALVKLMGVPKRSKPF